MSSYRLGIARHSFAKPSRKNWIVSPSPRHPVDVADRASLKAAIRPSVLRDEVRAF
jgi:hypothetical protein